VDKDSKRAILATKFGVEVISLAEDTDVSAKGLSLQVAPGSDLNSLSKQLKAGGIANEMRSDLTPGIRQAIHAVDPNGTSIDIYAETNLASEDTSDAAITPRKLGHVAFHTADIKRVVEFYKSILGFRVSDWRKGYFVFMRCSRDHHSVNFIETGSSAIHHMAFELRDETEIRRACDHIAKKEHKVFWGPIRHVIGHNIAAYHKNPDDLTVELFTDLDVMFDEELGYFEPRAPVASGPAAASEGLGRRHAN
jgi:catechol 2,3-dioxygenase-like lactoylglutathione lyase family enzyme